MLGVILYYHVLKGQQGDFLKVFSMIVGTLFKCLRPSQKNVPFPVARPTHFFRNVKKNSRFTSQRSKYFNLQAHDLVSLTTIGMM